jgi:peptidoglycan L-alanyl-D-glutamate endopeptidase CwlK
MSRSLDDLLPQVKEKAEEFLEACKAHGIDVLVTFTYRTWKEQDELYAQGRTKPGKIVTNAKGGQSIHQFRRAFDVCPLKDGKPDWDAPEMTWKVLGAIGTSIGLEWGGGWRKFVDLPHFQYTEGLTLAQMRENTVMA